MEGQVTFTVLLPPPLIAEGHVTFPLLITVGQVTVKTYCLSLGQIWPLSLVEYISIVSSVLGCLVTVKPINHMF